MTSGCGGPCAACGSVSLEPHMRVSGEVGEEGLVPTTDRFGTALGDIARCPWCGHMQLDPMPPGIVLDRGYREAASDDYVSEEAGQRATAATTLAAVERYTSPGSLLDIGCWVGFLLAEARDRGWEPVGIEPSVYASGYARERLGLDVLTGDLQTLPAGRRFRCVVMGDVIEHLPDPGATLDRVLALVEPQGVLALMLPDAGSRLARVMGPRWWSVIPTHVQYFTRHSLTVLLEHHGFVVRELTTAPKAFTIGYYLGRLEGYWRAGGRAAVAAADRLGVAGRIWAPDFRDRMLVLASPASR